MSKIEKMLKYIVIELCNTSTSYCNYQNDCQKPELISLDNLKSAILFSMKHNLNIQFLYPDYELPEEYNREIEGIDHIIIKPSSAFDISDADIVVLNGIHSAEGFKWSNKHIHIMRLSKSEMRALPSLFNSIGRNIKRLNVVLTDVESFTEPDFSQYKSTLCELVTLYSKIKAENNDIQLNLISDRFILEKMNNCNAGYETISVAPNGKFYLCPAFYHENEADFCGDVVNGLDVSNEQLYRIDHAPICRNCDAYQCKRCIWLNRKMTYEVNTPSREQCVVAHLERNAARQLLTDIRTLGTFLPEKEIKEIDYLDPFEIVLKRNGNA